MNRLFITIVLYKNRGIHISHNSGFSTLITSFNVPWSPASRGRHDSLRNIYPQYWSRSFPYLYVIPCWPGLQQILQALTSIYPYTPWKIRIRIHFYHLRFGVVLLLLNELGILIYPPSSCSRLLILPQYRSSYRGKFIHPLHSSLLQSLLFIFWIFCIRWFYHISLSFPSPRQIPAYISRWPPRSGRLFRRLCSASLSMFFPIISCTLSSSSMKNRDGNNKVVFPTLSSSSPIVFSLPLRTVLLLILIDRAAYHIVRELYSVFSAYSHPWLGTLYL